MVTRPSLEAFSTALRESRLLQPAQWAELSQQLLPRFHDPHGLARFLQGLGWLTPYQIDRLFRGQTKDLVLGQYVILDRLGEGGMARVFKARHQGLQRIVALKVLRTELEANSEAVRRFKREVRAISQLSHPNIVHAYDAEEVGNSIFYVMEFCEGIDLARLVDRGGPLSVDDACEYIRQAACGLAHAHERAQVHRDIKPANLLLTTGGATIKILDMGLVALRAAVEGSPQSVLTAEWSMLGTPDYVAPEQIMNARTVDHRADLYSLGCTFYYLLTGAPPFFEAGPREKTLMHRCMDPRPIREVRAEVPALVAETIHRLMAKLPEDRFQSAAELATRLAPVPEGDN
jgi:serine/threonine-protein kinase